ncbi:MAG: prepilin-type N-terminal cleavage/methylation domain-containing protein, partial [Verrucomicrobiota bacterium]
MRIICAPANRAFTLIEVVISSALMALILVSAYLCLSAGVAGKNIVEPRADIFQTVRVTLALLTADLRGACPLPGDSAFLGMKRMVGDTEADNLDFATHNYTPRRAQEGDFCETSYYVQQDPQSGHFSLWRRRNPTLAPDPMSGGSHRTGCGACFRRGVHSRRATCPSEDQPVRGAGFRGRRTEASRAGTGRKSARAA